MTNTQDTSPEAVERWDIEPDGSPWPHSEGDFVLYEDYVALSTALDVEREQVNEWRTRAQDRCAEAEKWFLKYEGEQSRAEAAEAARDKWRSMWEKEQTHNEELSAALETEKRHKLAITGDKINAVSELRQVKAERDALKAELAEAATHALDRLDASLFTNAEHQQAKDILRAFLARHQKEKEE